jgi:hypothetical protein
MFILAYKLELMELEFTHQLTFEDYKSGSLMCII